MKNRFRFDKAVLIAALLCVTLLVGCEPSASPVTFPVLPPELLDCKFYKISKGNGDRTIIARCPGSSATTSYGCGKNCVANNTVVDQVISTPEKKKSLDCKVISVATGSSDKETKLEVTCTE